MYSLMIGRENAGDFHVLAGNLAAEHRCLVNTCPRIVNGRTLLRDNQKIFFRCMYETRG